MKFSSKMEKCGLSPMRKFNGYADEAVKRGIKIYHLNIGQPLTADEIEVASRCDKNDRYQMIRYAVDKRVISGYHLWKTNYLAYDLVTGTTKYADHYSKEDLERFEHYTEHQLDKVERRLDRDELRKIFRDIYANPVKSKERLVSGEPFRTE